MPNWTLPDVPPSVSYRSMRGWQRSGVKPPGQWNLTPRSGDQAARGGRDCQHQGGRELGLSAMVNISESLQAS